MNKVELLGWIVDEPEIRYTKEEIPRPVAKYRLAVKRKYKRKGDVDADFFVCIAWGKLGSFVEKYLTKGQQIAIAGRLQNRSWADGDGTKKWITEIIVEEHYFAGSQGKAEKNKTEDDIDVDALSDDSPFL